MKGWLLRQHSRDNLIEDLKEGKWSATSTALEMSGDYVKNVKIEANIPEIPRFDMNKITKDGKRVPYDRIKPTKPKSD